MISLDLAVRLKEAGLQWKPKEGDFYFDGIERMVVPVYFEDDNGYISVTGGYAWLPRLDQLLAEIVLRGYRWNLYTYALPINNRMSYACEVFWGSLSFVGTGDNPENATARALIKILEREKEAGKGD